MGPTGPPGLRGEMGPTGPPGVSITNVRLNTDSNTKLSTLVVSLSDDTTQSIPLNAITDQDIKTISFQNTSIIFKYGSGQEITVDISPLVRGTLQPNTLILNNDVWINSKDNSNRLRFDANNKTHFSSQNGYVWKNKSNTDIYTILDNGNVGINITNPIHKFEVDGNVRVDNVSLEKDGKIDNMSTNIPWYGLGLNMSSNEMNISGKDGIIFNIQGIETNRPTRTLRIDKDGSLCIGNKCLQEQPGTGTSTNLVLCNRASNGTKGNCKIL